VTRLSKSGDAPNWSCEGGPGGLPHLSLNSLTAVVAAYCSSELRICHLYWLCRHYGKAGSNMAQYQRCAYNHFWARVK